MRSLAHFITVAGAGIALATLAVTQPVMAEETITVFLDMAKVIQLPEKTATVVLGNPLIADLTMLKRNNKMILTGKGYGETNLIALDSSGNAIGESTVRVAGADRSLTVQRGMERQSYRCDPRCQPTVTLGDTTSFLGDSAGQITTRNGASMASVPGGPH